MKKLMLGETGWIAMFIILFALVIIAAVITGMSQKTVDECLVDSDCGIGGCSDQICTSLEKAKNLITTCEWKETYWCLRETTCSCIKGKCEWKKTQEYLDCLREKE